METIPEKRETGEVRVLGPHTTPPKVYRVSGLAAVLIGLPLALIFGFFFAIAAVALVALMIGLSVTSMARTRSIRKKMRVEVKNRYAETKPIAEEK